MGAQGREGRQQKCRGTYESFAGWVKIGWGGRRGRGREQVCEGWRFLSKLWKDGSVEAGKRKRNEDITAVGKKKCVCECLLYCGGPTYPSILLRRLSAQEEGWHPLPQPRTHTHMPSLPLAASYTRSALRGSSRWRALDRPRKLLQVSHPPITRRLQKVPFLFWFSLSPSCHSWGFLRVCLSDSSLDSPPPPSRVMCVINVRVRGCMCVCVRLNVCLHRCLHSISESRFSYKNFS